jgi:hypothetical protein
MTNRTKKIIASVIALIILLLLLWLFSRQPELAPINTSNEAKTPTPIGALNATNGPGLKPPLFEATEPARPVVESEQPDVRSSLRSLASAFAERYGSYSNQGDYENLEELQVLMTDKFSQETAGFIRQSRAVDPGVATYIGLTTRSLNTTIRGLDELAGRATVIVNTQREEISARGGRVFYQEISLEFIREGEIWRVNSATWMEVGG